MSATRDSAVDALLAERDHPFTATIETIRAELLAQPGVVENVKWNSPNYALADDFATMSLRRDTAVQLILHTGAKPKPEHPTIAIDPLPRFAKRADRNRVVLTFTAADLSDAESTELSRLVSSWTAQLDSRPPQG